MEFSKPTEEWIYDNGEKIIDINNNNPFTDGKYWGYYEQKSQKAQNINNTTDINSGHTMLDMDLKFIDNGQNNNPMVTGKGTDCLGAYDITGIYSNDSKRMALEQMYTNENARVVNVRLKWNINQNQFKGTWYCKSDMDKCEGFGYWIISKCDDIIMDVIQNQNGNATASDHDNDTNIITNTHINYGHVPIATHMAHNTTSTVLSSPSTIMYDNHIKGVMVSGQSFSSMATHSRNTTGTATQNTNKSLMGFMMPHTSIDSTRTLSNLSEVMDSKYKKQKSIESVCGIPVQRHVQSEQQQLNKLPIGWREERTTDGRVYWQKEKTNEILWERPTKETVKNMHLQKSKHKHDGSTHF